MPRRDSRVRIDDILRAMDRIAEYTRGLDDVDAFAADAKTVDAVVRNFIVIGEAAGHVSEDIVAQAPHIPWKVLRDMRNVVVHEYWGVSARIIWETIQHDLPRLRLQLQDALKLK